MSTGLASLHAMRRGRGLVLAALLLAAQTAAVVHGADVERHLGPDVCQTCLLVATANAGILPGLAFVIATSDGTGLAAPLLRPAAARHAPAFQIRAPPTHTH